MQALDADKCIVKAQNASSIMQVALLAEPKTPLESSVFILLALRSRVRNYCSFPDEH